MYVEPFFPVDHYKLSSFTLGVIKAPVVWDKQMVVVLMTYSITCCHRQSVGTQATVLLSHGVSVPDVWHKKDSLPAPSGLAINGLPQLARLTARLNFLLPLPVGNTVLNSPRLSSRHKGWVVPSERKGRPLIKDELSPPGERN